MVLPGSFELWRPICLFSKCPCISPIFALECVGEEGEDLSSCFYCQTALFGAFSSYQLDPPLSSSELLLLLCRGVRERIKLSDWAISHHPYISISSLLSYKNILRNDKRLWVGQKIWVGKDFDLWFKALLT